MEFLHYIKLETHAFLVTSITTLSEELSFSSSNSHCRIREIFEFMMDTADVVSTRCIRTVQKCFGRSTLKMIYSLYNLFIVNGELIIFNANRQKHFWTVQKRRAGTTWYPLGTEKFLFYRSIIQLKSRTNDQYDFVFTQRYR